MIVFYSVSPSIVGFHQTLSLESLAKKMAEKINLSNLSQDQAARKKYSCRILLQEIRSSKLF